ncbi:hypothetical protein [Photobacterium ganghwense]|uniref:hypothetical protein n=1 Tax=Photobacterium ganghwense TaxID=320778 RepID=UPI001A8D3A9D|nr:hypothetical protein [Photobacterium ganghwense]QSV15469.1 hypothetical protein FH974_07880 [Photobacterium ganghwense]QSV17338.1 hypothetical protein FH974_20660 [Photobacterium ganghwense]
MITTSNFPPLYKPLDELEICSNKLIGGGNLISIGDVLPILIGAGRKPKVWLQAMQNKTRESFVTIVDNSKSMHPFVDVKNKNKITEFYVKDILILRVNNRTRTRAVVDYVNLQPLGINVIGDKSKLVAGNATFSNSTFMNVGTVLNFDIF